LYYATSGGIGQYTLPDPFSSPLNATTTRTYQSVGGRLTVQASSNGETARPIEYAYVVGEEIPNPEIKSRLLSLYRGPTPDLLAKIAWIESSFRQFAERTLFGYTGKWPIESPGNGGRYIGLMQVEFTTMARAWDWLVNSQAGADIFAEKQSMTRGIERQLRKQYPDLPPFTAAESEKMSLLLYGGWATRLELTRQYYLPQLIGGSWKWVKNTMNNPGGVAYVDKVLAYVVP
jgi:hypothetical protein